MTSDDVLRGGTQLAERYETVSVLGIFGDFYLLGRPIPGRVTKRMTGHSDNVALLRQLRARFGLPALRAVPAAASAPRCSS